MAIVVMICFARSGGTILNQCLGCLPNTVVLSEVNPLVEGRGEAAIPEQTVKEQAQNWYQIELSSDDFFEGIFELENICAATGKHLIVRDWSSVNFLPPGNYKATNKLLTIEGLTGKCEFIPFAFVRDSIDVWISYKMPDLQEFFTPYLSYVKEIDAKKIPIFKYEDFCHNPSQVIQNICNLTGLDYSESYNNYSEFTQVSGDIRFSSRGRLQSEIKPLQRRLIPREKIIELNQCKEMIEANRLLGYPISYYDAPLEKVWTKWIRGASKFVGKF